MRPDIAESGHIDTDIDTDIGYTPISGHSVTDVVHCIPDIGVDIGTNIDINILILILTPQYRDARYRGLQQPILVSISDTISGDTRHRCQFRTQYRVRRYWGLRTSDIFINIGHDIGLQTASVLPLG
jgi:hypothetical protein